MNGRVVKPGIIPCEVCHISIGCGQRFRVIVQNYFEPPQPTYLLTGIAAKLYHGAFHVSLDRNKQSRPNFNQRIDLVIGAGIRDNQGMKEYGFVVHTHCWKLTEQLIGPLVNNQLAVFLQVLEERWEQWKGVYDPEGMDLTCTRPMQAPAVWSLIKRCRLRKKATAVSASAPYRTSCSLVTSLPLEIKFMILDLLDHRAVGAMLIAIPLEVPDSYWRMRLHNGILFEVRQLDPELRFDWQILCLKSEALCAKMKPLRTRQRIIDVLKDIAEPFWARLSSDDRRELQDLIQERKKQLTKGPTQRPRKKKRRRRSILLRRRKRALAKRT